MPAEQQVILFVDNSNIFISAQRYAQIHEGPNVQSAIRINFDNLIKLAVAGRTLKSVSVVGSIPPEQKAIWDRLKEATGVEPELFERGNVSGSEQGIDQCLQVHMLRAISDNPEPKVVVLMTGDGAGYDNGIGFHADIERMHTAGWGVEVVTWDISCRKALKKWAEEKGCFIALEKYYDAVTFVKGGRHSSTLNLSSRAISRARLSPAQSAGIKAQQEAQLQIEKLNLS